MALAVFQNQLPQKIERRALIRTHPNQPALQTLHLGNRLSYLISQAQDSLCIVVNHLPRLREDGRFLRPIQEREPYFFFQTANRDTDGRLCPKYFVCSL